MKLPFSSFSKNRFGFTLVEVTLAIAVALIGILGVLAILPQGMQSARSAADNTISATIVENLFSQLRSSSFSNEVICSDADCSSTYGAFDLNNSQSVTFDYDQAGNPTNCTSAGSSDCGYYQVLLNTQAPVNGIVQVRAAVRWPEAALRNNHTPANSNIFTTAIARYDTP